MAKVQERIEEPQDATIAEPGGTPMPAEEFELDSANKGFSPVALVVKNPLANAGDIGDVGSISGSEGSLGGGHSNPLQYSCLENPHGQRSLAGYSPWGCKELDTTEGLSTAHSLP